PEDDFLAQVVSVNGEGNYLISVVQRLMIWPVLALGQGILGLVVPVMLLLAFWAARRGILERPGDHLRLLRRTAVIGLLVAAAGGVPHALHHLGPVASGEPIGLAFSLLQPWSGLFGGL